MATTNKVLRSYLDRIIHIRRTLKPALDKEIEDLASRFDLGTYRSSDVPGIKVAITEASSQGYTTLWKEVALELQERFDISDTVFKNAKRRHQIFSSTTRTRRVSVSKDTAVHPDKKTML